METWELLQIRYRLSQNEFLVRMTLLSLMNILSIMVLEVLMLLSFIRRNSTVNSTENDEIQDNQISVIPDIFEGKYTKKIYKFLVTVAFCFAITFLFALFSLTFVNLRITNKVLR
ncbi:unnamed protein product [Gordionus sp. m RMFG-2023]